ncbi:MAG: hypothetical protein ABIS35_04040 [Terracoccus sp.]
MRWDRLFDDLEAQAASDEARDLHWEIADRTRRERALIDLHARLLADVGTALTVRLPGGPIEGILVDVGPDWVLLETPARRPVLIVLAAVRSVVGPGGRAVGPSPVARRFGLGAALRAVSRDRSTVELVDVDGGVTTGTVDVVGGDHLDLAEHPVEVPRRRANVVAHHVVPFAAIAFIRRL